jgi:hypothetical protein
MISTVTAYLLIFILFTSFKISVSEIMVLFELFRNNSNIILHKDQHQHQNGTYSKNNIYMV